MFKYYTESMSCVGTNKIINVTNIHWKKMHTYSAIKKNYTLININIHIIHIHFTNGIACRDSNMLLKYINPIWNFSLYIVSRDQIIGIWKIVYRTSHIVITKHKFNNILWTHRESGLFMQPKRQDNFSRPTRMDNSKVDWLFRPF